MQSIAQHCHELDRCNQRGGRMLSVLDLLDAGTMNLDLAAYLMARISRGTSFLVGALPGGAGKTTIMCALLNFVPVECHLAAATSGAVQDASRGMVSENTCSICHEIGAGPYFAYLWGRDLRAYCALAAKGIMRATNLHADTLAEAKAQVCGDNGVPEAHFNAFGLAAFIRVSGRSRTLVSVHASDEVSPHRQVYDADGQLDTRGVNADWLAACRDFLARAYASPARTIEDTRTLVVKFLGK